MAAPVGNCNRYQRGIGITAGGTSNDVTSALRLPAQRGS